MGSMNGRNGTGPNGKADHESDTHPEHAVEKAKNAGGENHALAGDGGEGGVDLFEQPGGRSRESLRLIQRAVRNGWKIDPKWLEAVPKETMRIMLSSKDERNRLRAAELMQAIHRDATNAAISLDKIERLDDGRATEHVAGQTVLKVEFDER